VLKEATLNAREEAARLLQEAREQAAALLQSAGQQAAALREQTQSVAHAEAAARLAAAWLELEARRDQLERDGLERVLQLARLLAERILGQELRQSPEAIVSLARKTLEEARGARQLEICAHPEDAQLLEAHLGALGFEVGRVTIAAAGDLARGDLRIETNLGHLDGFLAPRLDRLLELLREKLAP